MKWVRKHMMLIAGIYTVLIPLILALTISTTIERQQVAFIQGQVANACHRLNVVRVDQTRNDLAVYRFFTVTAADLTIAAKRAPQTQRQPTLAFSRLLYNDAFHLVWIPLTNCDQAQREGLAFAAPASIRYKTRLPGARNLNLGSEN